MKEYWLYERGRFIEGEVVTLTPEQYKNVRNGYGDYLIRPLEALSATADDFAEMPR